MRPRHRGSQGARPRPSTTLLERERGPHQMHRGRLWPLLAQLLGEPDFVTNAQLVEFSIDHAVAMEIDLPRIGRSDEAVAPLWVQPNDAALSGRVVGFDVSACLTDVVLELTPGRIEGVADRHVDVLVRALLRGLAPRDTQVNADVEQFALSMLPVRRLDHHANARDPIVELLELGGLLPDVGLDGRRRRHVPEADLQWNLHTVTKHPMCQGSQRPTAMVHSPRWE